MITAGIFYCECCGAAKPGPHYAGCAAIGGFYPAPTPTYEQHDRIAVALERIATVLEQAEMRRAKP